MPKKKSGERTIVQNRKAYHDYFIEETLEAGIELCGTEVKSLRAGNANLKEAWCAVQEGEIFIRGMHISPYEQGNIFNRDPFRARRLLLHKREIARLTGLISREGLTLIPLSLYFKGSLVKVQLGVCRGKKLYDKRETAARRDSAREIERAIKTRNQ